MHTEAKSYLKQVTVAIRVFQMPQCPILSSPPNTHVSDTHSQNVPVLITMWKIAEDLEC